MLSRTGGIKMNLSAPKQASFIVAVVLAVVGLLAALVQIPVLTGLAFWLVIIGFIVLAVSVLVPGV
jgi:threonine/homoserine/homoserine lactone efflux protein